MPFAFSLLSRNKKSDSFSISGFAQSAAADSIFVKNLCSIQKQLEQTLPEGNSDISIYEFRATIERYIGLTIARQIDDAPKMESELEIFRVSQMKNAELGSICLKRRNRKRLCFHQIEARKDFLYLINQLINCGADKNRLRRLAIELVKILKDFDAQQELEKRLIVSSQIGISPSVQILEKDLWKPEIQIPASGKQISPPIRVMKTTAGLRRKD